MPHYIIMSPGCVSLILIPKLMDFREYESDYKVIRVMAEHLEKHTLSGMDEISGHTGGSRRINDASRLLEGLERR